jgi:hypothetical protein
MELVGCHHWLQVRGLEVRGLEVRIMDWIRISIWIRVFEIVDHYNPIIPIKWHYNANRLLVTTCRTAE